MPRPNKQAPWLAPSQRNNSNAFSPECPPSMSYELFSARKADKSTHVGTSRLSHETTRDTPLLLLNRNLLMNVRPDQSRSFFCGATPRPFLYVSPNWERVKLDAQHFSQPTSAFRHASKILHYVGANVAIERHEWRRGYLTLTNLDPEQYGRAGPQQFYHNHRQSPLILKRVVRPGFDVYLIPEGLEPVSNQSRYTPRNRASDFV